VPVRNQWYLIPILAAVLLIGDAIADERRIEYSTDDNVTIVATVSEPRNVKDSTAAVIFIHQGGSSRKEWTSLEVFRQISEQGMLALAYDVRGHGESSGEADFSTLFDDPLQAPRDLAAAIDWLEQSGQVDMSRIAIVGASIGANLACVAAGSRDFNIRTAVAMSAKVSAVFNLAGGEEKLTGLKSVFLIASELEQDGQRAVWAADLFALTEAPRQLEIVTGSSGHGVSVFADDPTLQERILDWLLRTL
jgi:dipeptidyl aminopeptidase/acylaminoacyl peptidase